MFRSALSILLTVSTLTVTAQTPSTPPGPSLDRQWKEVAALPPGTPLLLRLHAQPQAFECSLVWIDLDSIACENLDLSGAPHRVVYPETSIASVKRELTEAEQAAHRRATSLLFGMAAGGLFGGLVGQNGGIRSGFAGAGIGALFGGGIAAAHTSFGPSFQPVIVFPLHRPCCRYARSTPAPSALP